MAENPRTVTKNENNQIQSKEIKIRGVVTEPKCWSARYFANFAKVKCPSHYKVDVKFLFQLEWSYMKRKLRGEGVEVPKMGQPLCAVWVDDRFIGDDISLCKYLIEDGYIEENYLYAVLNVSVQISTDALSYCPRDIRRSYVYFDIYVDEKNIGRLLLEIFCDIMPESCDRFLKECKRYEGCPIHRITRDGWFESGKFLNEDPPTREKRPPGLSNFREGMLSLVNTGRTNCKSSQFLITLGPALHLDPYHCPIGAALDGKQVLNEINKLETHFDSPIKNVYLKDVTVLYSPKEVARRNHLLVARPVETPAMVWIQDEKGELPHTDDFKKFRTELKPTFEQLITDDLNVKLNEIRLQLYQENRKLKEVMEEDRFKLIVTSVLDREKRDNKPMEYDEEELKKMADKKWFSILINADSEFDLFYKPTNLPKIYSESREKWLHNQLIMNNPTVLHLMQYVNKKDLVQVLDLIQRLMDNAINAAIQQAGQQMYVEPISVDYTSPLGNELANLPESMQHILADEVCNLSISAFDLFRSTIKYILEAATESRLDHATSTVSADMMTIINITKSYLGIQTLSEEEIEKRKESLIEDVNFLTENMSNIYQKCRSKKAMRTSVGIASPRRKPGASSGTVQKSMVISASDSKSANTISRKSDSKKSVDTDSDRRVGDITSLGRKNGDSIVSGQKSTDNTTTNRQTFPERKVYNVYTTETSGNPIYSGRKTTDISGSGRKFSDYTSHQRNPVNSGRKSADSTIFKRKISPVTSGRISADSAAINRKTIHNDYPGRKSLDIPYPGRKPLDVPFPGRKYGDSTTRIGKTLDYPGRKSLDIPYPGRKLLDIPFPGRKYGDSTTRIGKTLDTIASGSTNDNVSSDGKAANTFPRRKSNYNPFSERKQINTASSMKTTANVRKFK